MSLNWVSHRNMNEWGVDGLQPLCFCTFSEKNNLSGTSRPFKHCRNRQRQIFSTSVLLSTTASKLLCKLCFWQWLSAVYIQTKSVAEIQSIGSMCPFLCSLFYQPITSNACICHVRLCVCVCMCACMRMHVSVCEGEPMCTCHCLCTC